MHDSNERSWTLIEEKKPEPCMNVEYIDHDGDTGKAYLCGRCRNCWRDPITGSGIMINVIKWRYVNETEEEDQGCLYDEYVDVEVGDFED